MNTREWPASTWIAAVTFVAALVIDAVILIRDPVVEPSSSLALPSPTPIRVHPIEGADLVRDASNRTPFGGTPASAVAHTANGMLPPIQAPLPVVRPRLIGTVIEREGGFVVLELPDTRVLVVRIGEKVGDMHLRSVTAGEAVFDDPREGRITLRTPQPGRPDTRP